MDGDVISAGGDAARNHLFLLIEFDFATGDQFGDGSHHCVTKCVMTFALKKAI